MNRISKSEENDEASIYSLASFLFILLNPVHPVEVFVFLHVSVVQRILAGRAAVQYNRVALSREEAHNVYHISE
jgi:hypothetical protein